MPRSRPAVWGIVNVTPDSFSDGGLLPSADAGIAHGLALAAAGADVLDIGGESTRPGAAPVSVDEKCQRVLPVIDGLMAAGCPVPISIDTRRTEVAAPAIDAGASIVNDVSAGQDEGMLTLVQSTGVQLVLMHMQGTPQTMQADPHYVDVVADVSHWLASKVAGAEAVGIARPKLWIDPGIGFGKTVEHNLALIRAVGSLRAKIPGTRLLLGASRKRFLGALTDRDVPADRLVGSLGCVAWAFAQGVDAVRVHDVAETADLLRILSAIQDAPSA